MASDMPNPGEPQICEVGSETSVTAIACEYEYEWEGNSVQESSQMTRSAQIAFRLPDSFQRWINLFYDVISGQDPNSVQADKKGLALGKFLVEHADLAEQLEVTRKKFGNSVFAADVSVTYFENWASTTTGLLLYAKPTTVHQVKNLVKKANDLGVKVCI